MSINTAHAYNGTGVVLFVGERILLFTEDVGLGFSDNSAPPFKGEKKGKIFLTSHRVIFINSHQNDLIHSFSIPFTCMREVELEQPIFGANYIKGKVLAENGGNWAGSVKFKLWFFSGGAIEFGQAMMNAGRLAMRNRDVPLPAYQATGDITLAPPPSYSLLYGDPNYGWLPYTVFPTAPPASDVYMVNAPPPYPGMTAPMYAPPQNAAMYQTPAAYYDPNNPHVGYTGHSDPPPAYGEVEITEKKRL